MNEHENWIRFNCLELASKHNPKKPVKDIITSAKQMERYVLNIPRGKVLKLATKKDQ
jgi:hypothetical protein